MNEVICKEVIITSLKRRGQGTSISPIRVITEVYEKDGTLIAEYDPSPETFALMDLIHFARWVKDRGFDPEKLDAGIVAKWVDELNKQK